MIYGAGAGYAMWLSDYPIDVIKSRLQTDPLRSTGRRQYRNSLHCASILWRAEGWKGFVRGSVFPLI
jgi:solute carrier family 25 carnitine/acylcarnitine transporter 20/29